MQVINRWLAGAFDSQRIAFHPTLRTIHLDFVPAPVCKPTYDLDVGIILNRCIRVEMSLPGYWIDGSRGSLYRSITANFLGWECRCHSRSRRWCMSRDCRAHS